MVTNNGFRFASGSEVEKAIKKRAVVLSNAQKPLVMGIFSNNDLISYVRINLEEGPVPIVEALWQVSPSSKIVREFRKIYGATPSGYLQEELIRKGFEHANAKFILQGPKLVSRLLKRGLIEKLEHGSQIRANKKWMDLAKSRSRLLK